MQAPQQGILRLWGKKQLLYLHKEQNLTDCPFLATVDLAVCK